MNNKFLFESIKNGSFQLEFQLDYSQSTVYWLSIRILIMQRI